MPAKRTLSAVVLCGAAAYAVYQYRAISSGFSASNWRGYSPEPYVPSLMGDIGGQPTGLITDIAVTFDSQHTTQQVLHSGDVQPQSWRRLGKDLYLHAGPRVAYLNVVQKPAQDVTADEIVVKDISIGERPPYSSASPKAQWESRSAGIWVLRDEYDGVTESAITGLDVLFGTDSVDPRDQWHLIEPPLQLGAPADTPGARLTVHRGEARPPARPEQRLRANANGKFRLMQISDTHMVTGVGLCKDAIDADGEHLSDREADPLTVRFLEGILDIEKPDLVILTGDQLHHDILDSQSAILKTFAPLIERKITYVAVFGNHDDEGTWAVSRTAQMSLMQSLPYSLCEAGASRVHGVGNYYLQLYDHDDEDAKRPFATLFLLDSHGQAPSSVKNPDYVPIQPSQIDWFRTSSASLRRERQSNNTNKEHLSLAFMHIPIPEYGDSDLVLAGGQRREPTEGPKVNTHFYDALVEESVIAVGSGHDHVNDFCGLLPRRHKDLRATGTQEVGPWLCHNGGSGFGGYMSYGKNRYHRRLRVWEFDANTGGLTTWKRVEYHSDRVDEITLAARGQLVGPPA